MSAFIQGQYGYSELYARKNRVAYFVFNVPNGSQDVNVNSYSALRLNVADTQGNVSISLNTNALGLTAINVNNVLINASATQMNVNSGYYQFDFEGLSTRGWEPLVTGQFRIDE